jgi:hypothetical protein
MQRTALRAAADAERWAAAVPGAALTSAIVSRVRRGALVASARRSGFLPLRAMQAAQAALLRTEKSRAPPNRAGSSPCRSGGRLAALAGGAEALRLRVAVREAALSGKRA